MISENEAFEQWKAFKFEMLFKDAYAGKREQLVANTISGVHSVPSVSSQGMFGSKKPASNVPRVDGKNKFTP